MDEAKILQLAHELNAKGINVEALLQEALTPKSGEEGWRDFGDGMTQYFPLGRGSLENDHDDWGFG